MMKIDALATVRAMESVLRSSADPVRCGDYLAALRRWQWDDMMDDETRRAARRIVHDFDPEWTRLEFAFRS